MSPVLRSIRGRRRRQECLDLIALLVGKSARPPEMTERPGQAQTHVDVAFKAPRERCAQVVDLGIQQIRPGGTPRLGQLATRPFGEFRVEPRVAGAHGLGLAARAETFPGVLSERLQQAVAGRSASRLGKDQRFFDKVAQSLQHVSPACPRLGDGAGGVVSKEGRRHRFDRVQREATGEHREPSEQRALRLG
jgi:hypothetical protein